MHTTIYSAFAVYELNGKKVCEIQAGVAHQEEHLLLELFTKLGIRLNGRKQCPTCSLFLPLK